MSDEDIKQSLEEFQNRILKTNLSYHIFESEMMAVVNALDLINRQQAEIERLKWEKDHFEFKVDDLNGKLEKFKEYRDIKNEAYEREIEKLQAEIEKWKVEYTKACAERDARICTQDYFKSEAIKEFAERLKSRLFYECGDINFSETCETRRLIDNLLAEMVGGMNEKSN